MRSDADSWDITTGVGSTALFVSAARALAGRAPDPLAVDPFAEIFLRAVGGEWAALLDGKAPGHPLTDPGFGLGFQEFQAARTRYFDDYFRDTAAAGVRQVVILAAGLDARAYRLEWPDGTVVYELDRPPVLQFKRETLAANGDAPRAERREVPVDLRKDWPQALRECGFDSSTPTAWLAEGLLIYLPAATQDQLFETIDALSASGSRVAIEQMDTLRDETAAQAHADARSEWRSLIYNEPRSEVTTWFTARGWSAKRVALPEYLRAHGRPDLALEPEAQMFALISLVTAAKP